MSEDGRTSVDLLRSVKLFSKVDAAWLSNLESLLVEVEVAEDAQVFRAGDAADALYVVKAGQVVVFTDTPGRPVRLVERLGPGELLGLVGALGGSQRAASARASTPSRLLRLARADLLRLLEQDASLGLRFTLAAVSRHARNAAAALELRDRSEVRIRIDCPVDLVIGHLQPVRVNLENLSLGGICFDGAPAAALPPGPTWYTVHLPDGDPVLRFHGRVAWRRGSRTGLAFTSRAPGHDLLIQGALRRLLRGSSSRAGRTATDSAPTAPTDAAAG